MYFHKQLDSNQSDEQTRFDTQQLVAQIIQKEKSAESILVERYWRSLYFILCKRAEDPELAKDIAQETFITVLKNIQAGKLNNALALGKYIRETGLNILLAHYRKETRRGTSTDSTLDVVVPDNSPDLYRLLYGKQSVTLVTQLLNELTQERDRELLMALYLYGKDKAQICQELALSHDNFDKILHRARARLKQIATHKLENGYVELTSANSFLLIFIIFLSTGNDLPKKYRKLLYPVEGNTLTHHLSHQGTTDINLIRQVNKEIRD